ncbi:DUF397 domain-containing protein [Streptomyces sp. NPDC088116]|uniref:DUF397 domain-containing protein n=1 Tax=Streptomyces sp. NPDC088116 TaxID=3365825 RepID=UPI0038182EF5
MNLNPAPTVWVKSSYTSHEGGNCVEWSPTYAHDYGVVPVRDSKAPQRRSLTFTPAAWSGFVTFAAGLQSARTTP